MKEERVPIPLDMLPTEREVDLIVAQGQEAFRHVHCSLLVLRRCLQGVSYRNERTAELTSLGHCQRPATLIQEITETDAHFSCDACAKAFEFDSMVDLPHAGVVRRYNAYAASKESLQAVTAPQALELARALALVLPPCPNVSVDWPVLEAIRAAPGSALLSPDEYARLAKVALNVKGDPDGSCVRCEMVVITPRPLEALDEFLAGVPS